MHPAFTDWSPAQLAHALGYIVDLRTRGVGNREIWLVGPTGRAHRTGHERACATLSRLACWRKLDPLAPPPQTPRALINGKPRCDP